MPFAAEDFQRAAERARNPRYLAAVLPVPESLMEDAMSAKTDYDEAWRKVAEAVASRPTEMLSTFVWRANG